MNRPYEIQESDWKLFRQLRVIVLERYCERVLGEINGIASDSGKTPHRQYLAIWDLLQRRNREMAHAFDDPRRSVARIQLQFIWSLGLLTGDEVARFSKEIRESLLNS